MPTPTPVISTLRCAIQIGFAGSRRLLADDTDIDTAAFSQQIETHLQKCLRKLPQTLGLAPHHFQCGISQIAIGADILFSRALQTLDWPQRIFLPQPRREYLNAHSSDGTPDFSEAERAKAEALLDSQHVIEERVVSDAHERTAQFEDTNLEILRISDVVICLLRAEAEGKPGGTNDLLTRAKTRGKAVLELRVGANGGQAEISERWHNLEQFTPPQLPQQLARPDGQTDDAELPDIAAYCTQVKSVASNKAKRFRWLFNIVAIVIISTHILATICATLVLADHSTHNLPTSALLGFELILLMLGFMVHRYLHHSNAVRAWAFHRLVAEITRSVNKVGALHTPLTYLSLLPLPDGLRPLLRTLNVLHLRSTRPQRAEPWETCRASYIEKRLTDPEDGQLHYYPKKIRKARTWLKWSNRGFFFFSLLAIGATTIKLVLVLLGISTGTAFLGVMAIVLPVLAVAAVSLAAAQDLEARVHTYEDTLSFLEIQKPHLEQAGSSREFQQLLQETETRLLGETSNWYSRRSFTEVA